MLVIGSRGKEAKSKKKLMQMHYLFTNSQNDADVVAIGDKFFKLRNVESD